MDQVTLSTYFTVVVSLQNNAEITMLNVLALKKKTNHKQPPIVKRGGQNKYGKSLRN